MGNECVCMNNEEHKTEIESKSKSKHNRLNEYNDSIIIMDDDDYYYNTEELPTSTNKQNKKKTRRIKRREKEEENDICNLRNVKMLLRIK